MTNNYSFLSLLFENSIPINQLQAQKLFNIFSSIGIEPNTVIKVDKQEPTETEDVIKTEAKVSTKNKFRMDIPVDVMNAALKLYEIGKDAQDWYYNAAKTISDAFPYEHEKVFFALLLASTSPQTEVYSNFLEAAIMFNAFQKDAQENTELLDEFLSFDNIPNDEKYKALNIFKDAKTAKIMLNSKIGNIYRTAQMYWNYGLDKGTVTNIILNSVKSQERSFNIRAPFIRALKVANYALTLIDPSLSSTSENPFNVVIDTWMYRVFFPGITKSDIMKLFGDEVAYHNVAKAVSVLATSAGISPHAMQAALWTGLKRTQEGEGGISDYVGTIDNLINEYGEFWKEVEGETNSLRKILAGLTPELGGKLINKRRGDSARARFSKRREMAAQNVGTESKTEKTVKIYHFTKALNEPKVTLEPTKFGANAFTKGDVNASSVPRVMFYLNPADKEVFFSDPSIVSLYSADINLGDVYDLTTDPQKLIRKFRGDIDEILRYLSGWEMVKDKKSNKYIWKLGESKYKGIKYQTGGIVMINWFEPIKAIKISPIETKVNNKN